MTIERVWDVGGKVSVSGALTPGAYRQRQPAGHQQQATERRDGPQPMGACQGQQVQRAGKRRHSQAP